MEKCPKCKSRFIQYDNITKECYCLQKDCNYRWKEILNFNNIENMYLRVSIKK